MIKFFCFREKLNNDDELILKVNIYLITILCSIFYSFCSFLIFQLVIAGACAYFSSCHCWCIFLFFSLSLLVHFIQIIFKQLRSMKPMQPNKCPDKTLSPLLTRSYSHWNQVIIHYKNLERWWICASIRAEKNKSN